jgi:ectoine hydroxylase-related dioxygenase (phytanoyl-CoA dioxygenase family)
VPHVIDRDLVARLRQDIDRYAVSKSSASLDRTLVDGYPRLVTFRRIVDDRHVRTLAVDVCGEDTALCLVKGAVRVSGEGELALHTDTGARTSSPFRRPAQFFTVHIVCDSLRKERGATFFVRGSHRLLRDPTPTEAAGADRAWVDAEPGDLVCWLGETWHGRFERTVPGERVSLFIMFATPDLEVSARRGR